MDTATYIYALADPNTGDVRYVGKSMNPMARFRIHLNDMSDTQRGRWVRHLKNNGLRPLFYLLEGPCADWGEAERRWIASYLAEGADLTNGNAGGAGVSRHSAATLKRMSESHRRKHAANGGHSQETRAKIGAANAKALKGRKHDPETLAKITAAMRANPPNLGRKFSAEWRANIATANRARLVSVCDICEQEIRGGKQNLVVHKKWRHSASPPEQPLLTCDVCGREVCSAAGLASHKRSHSTNRTPSKRRSTRGPSTVVLTCDTCGTLVKGPSAMATHLAFHAMPVTACDVCGQQVKGTGAMTTHMRWKHPAL